jgi:hypothetical protein
MPSALSPSLTLFSLDRNLLNTILQDLYKDFESLDAAQKVRNVGKRRRKESRENSREHWTSNGGG